MRLYGNPEKLVEHVVEEVIKEIRPEVDKAYEDAMKLLEQAFKQTLEEAKERLAGEYNRALDEIRSLEATLEKDMKLEASRKRSEAVEGVLKEVKKRLAELPGDVKQNIYSRLARDFAQKAQGGESYRVLAKKGEAQLVRKAFQDKSVAELLKGKGVKIKITEGLDTELGGFRAESEEGKIVFDYTLELVFESLKPTLSGTASKVLFEE